MSQKTTEWLTKRLLLVAAIIDSFELLPDDASQFVESRVKNFAETGVGATMLWVVIHDPTIL